VIVKEIKRRLSKADTIEPVELAGLLKGFGVKITNEQLLEPLVSPKNSLLEKRASFKK